MALGEVEAQNWYWVLPERQGKPVKRIKATTLQGKTERGPGDRKGLVVPQE